METCSHIICFYGSVCEGLKHILTFLFILLCKNAINLHLTYISNVNFDNIIQCAIINNFLLHYMTSDISTEGLVNLTNYSTMNARFKSRCRVYTCRRSSLFLFRNCESDFSTDELATREKIQLYN